MSTSNSEKALEIVSALRIISSSALTWQQLKPLFEKGTEVTEQDVEDAFDATDNLIDGLLEDDN